MSSYKTTAAAICALIVALVTALCAIFDGNPDSVADWAPVAAAGTAAVGLFFARDNDKSSEDVGAKKKP